MGVLGYFIIGLIMALILAPLTTILFVKNIKVFGGDDSDAEEGRGWVFGVTAGIFFFGWWLIWIPYLLFLIGFFIYKKLFYKEKQPEVKRR